MLCHLETAGLVLLKVLNGIPPPRKTPGDPVCAWKGGSEERDVGGFGGEMLALLRSGLPWRLAHLTPEGSGSPSCSS